MSEKRIFVGCDHGGLEMKLDLVQLLKDRGWEVVDYGCDTPESVDYPDYAALVAAKVVSDPGSLGMLVCGTGIGMSMAANKVKGARAALCSDTFSAEMTRRHNDANIICLGGRVLGPELARAILVSFTEASFDGGRHQRRIDKFADRG